jgi:branched-chain amino acid transport system permease protein
VRGRPLLHTSYESDQALLNTTTKRVVTGLFLLFLVLVPFQLVPGFGFLAQSDWLRLLSTVCIFAIGALGLNILTGLAGQVSLGHAFFMGIGAYTAAWLGAAPGALVGMGLPIWIWLPAAGLVAALVGVAVAPTAVRVRGLYLAFVTLGLVFIGEYLFRRFVNVTGGSQSGRGFPALELKLWKEEEPVISFATDGPWFGYQLPGEAKTFYLLLALTVVFVVLAKNLQRTRVGRAFQSIRDRDIAAEIMGVEETRYKLTAFGISSFYAGVAGALFASFVGRAIPEAWSLFLSVEFIAIVLIGGAGVVSGALLGTVFVIILPRLVEDFTSWMVSYVVAGEGFFVPVADLLVSTGSGDWGLINAQAGVAPGLGVAQLNQVLYGLLIIGFLIFEPLGLYGIWLRIRNYWKGWPFTY